MTLRELHELLKNNQIELADITENEIIFYNTDKLNLSANSDIIYNDPHMIFKWPSLKLISVSAVSSFASTGQTACNSDTLQEFAWLKW